MINKYQKNNKGGYAILFTVVIVGIISMISIGLSNSAYKQTILSAVARDSTTAFYQADIGAECAMYVDAKFQGNTIPMNSIETDWKCGDKVVTFGDPVQSKDTDGNEQYTYTLDLGTDGSLAKKCFRIDIIKKFIEVPAPSVETEIKSKGYNICNINNVRTVERALKITY